MRKLKRLSVACAAMIFFISAAVSCESRSVGNIKDNPAPTEQTYEEEPETETENNGISGTVITWLADYDINPSSNSERSVALSIFEDFYGCSINYVQTTSEDKFTKLSSMIISGEEVDMFPFEWDAVPNGVMKQQYEPLDSYYDILEMDNDELWGDMYEITEDFSYDGQHYVIPYCISSPLILTYSRNLMQSLGLDDPYELYLKGEWDWDVFMDMMTTFKSANPSGYGINGWFGQAVIQSTGKTVINYEDGVFKNNINDPEIEKAELLMQNIAKNNLYRSDWVGYYPSDGSTLFFAMGDWAIGTSNAKNPDDDLMVVPFPKSPDADRYYLSCNYGAKMLVRNSQHGEAVAAYIKCERLAQTQPEYIELAKQKALVPDQTAAGVVRSVVTEEQYDAVMSFLNPENTCPVFDFGYGMGERMYGNGDYTYETRGVMDNLASALLDRNSPVDSWETLRDQWTGVIDSVIESYNE